MLFNSFFTTNSPSDVSPTEQIVSATDAAAASDSDILGIFKNADPGRFIEMLPKLAMGMISIFIVIGVIIVATSLLNKIFSKKKKKEN